MSLHATDTRTGNAPAPTGPLSTIDYSERIPNNVNLAGDRRLQRALESWQPKFLDWWKQLGPALPTQDVYLRTAIAVGRDGWAHFDHVPMEQYRWGIFLAEQDPDRTIAFGKHKGEPAWQEVPGEYRAELMRLITVQGDTEPASVEQQRVLGNTAPSLYDLRNLFQVNVEEGRHLWAMVYLLQAYFGREGRAEAEQLLKRNSGDLDSPRILGAFNEETTDWLQFFMFTYFTDRDGKYQLGTLKESAFDPLARTCEFMLKEEAHHMFVGTTGVQRVVERTAEVMVELSSGGDGRVEPAKIFAAGAIPLEVIQKYLNFQYSVSMDLFGSERSSNVAAYYTAGLKGRWQETRRKDDHLLTDDTREVKTVRDGTIISETVPMLTALNLDLRDEYVADCENGVRRWNRALEDAGLEQRLFLPHEGFNRKVGAYSGHHVSPDGTVLTDEQWDAQVGAWLPNDDDRAAVAALMVPHYEPGEFAGWITAPKTGINDQPVEFDYVHLAEEALG
ncbi:benzoyl-CoA 2,3-epoxidase subunit BoxB [uncultured Jatrophihabitans sp.]|uniref:benzoyl-CoA 2,3-epoxidase subunit BoxB n=1 Tax=uncultured Jatrophihabitans sp. TaxID=1610747 RepID=UPI0035CBC4FE